MNQRGAYAAQREPKRRKRDQGAASRRAKNEKVDVSKQWDGTDALDGRTGNIRHIDINEKRKMLKQRWTGRTDWTDGRRKYYT